jgi:hypothetical protein
MADSAARPKPSASHQGRKVFQRALFVNRPFGITGATFTSKSSGSVGD